MSHFTVLVIGEDAEEQLAPFSENLEMERYVRYTKEQLIANFKTQLEEYKNGTYAEFLADPEAYKASSGNLAHIEYLEKEFPARLNWTDEEIYAYEIADYEEDDLSPEGGIYSTYNPDSKWDWYELGGRWTGYFKLKDTDSARENSEVGRPGLMTEGAKEGFADSAYKKDIDFDGMRDEAGKDAAESYDDAMARLGDLPVQESWEVIRARVKPIDEARKVYWDQPRCKVEGVHNPDRYLVSREEYIQNARNNALSTLAVLKDGVWYEKGEMGWFGIVHNEKGQEQWNEEFAKLIDELPDDTLISIYDCHI